MKFEVTGHLQDANGQVVGLKIAVAGCLPPERFEVGEEVQVETFEQEPALARYLAAITEARQARRAGTELRSGDCAYHEERALALLLDEVDP